MGIADLPEDHPLAEKRLAMLHETAGKETADRFEARYLECLDQGASKDQARQIAQGEILADMGEDAAEKVGEGYKSVDDIRHENEQWRALAGISPPDES